MKNTLGITLEIINNYPCTKLSVRIIGAIKRQFFHMVTHAFDNSNLSQEIFAIDTWRAVKPGLHIVVRIAEHACDDASKRILKLSTYRLKILPVKYQNV